MIPKPFKTIKPISPLKFKTTVGTLDSNVYNFHLVVPAKIYDQLTKDGKKRVLCTVNDNDYFHAGLMPKGDGDYFIMLNKTRMKQFDLGAGQEVDIVLEKDTSKYGMKMPPEFEEVLGTDLKGLEWFEKLTEGKKRNLIHIVASVKNPDIRITKALIILDHLKANSGTIDFKLLNEAMKLKNRKY